MDATFTSIRIYIEKHNQTNWYTNRRTNPPLLHDPGGGGGHAVDTEVHLAVVVADGDAEPAKVGPNDLDPVVGGAGEGEGLSLAPVGRLVAGSVGADPWKKTKILLK